MRAVTQVSHFTAYGLIGQRSDTVDTDGKMDTPDQPGKVVTVDIGGTDDMPDQAGQPGMVGHNILLNWC